MLKIDRAKLYEEIGRRVRTARVSRNPKLTQDELAKKLGVERTSIANIEKGTQRATLHFLYSLAQHLQTSLETFLPPIDDAHIIDTGAVSDLAEVKLGKRTRAVPRSAKSLYEKF